jgi:HSP20 family molecular chaperone IbpA
MSEKEKIKTASNNVIDIMSTLGKQFVEEAIEHGEPIFNIINQLAKKEEPNKDNSDNSYNIFNKAICHKINDNITYNGEKDIYSEVFEYSESTVILFKLPGVNKQDLILEKKVNDLDIFCKTSIGDTRMPDFKYKDREIKFNLKINYNIQIYNIMAELKDGILKLSIEKPEKTDEKEEIITVV